MMKKINQTTKSTFIKYIFVFIFGSIFTFSLTNGFNIVSGISNAVQYIKTIVLTSNGSSSGITGVILEGLSGKVGSNYLCNADLSNCKTTTNILGLTAGATGATGAAGVDGIDGEIGPRGNTGAIGATGAAGTGGNPGGSNTNIQFNNAGNFSGASDFVRFNGKLGIGVSNPNNTIQVKDLINFPNGGNSTFIGYEAGFSYGSNPSPNTAIGYRALYYNVGGIWNTALGYSALYNNTIGNSNTAIGNMSLYNNVSGFNNTAVGYNSLYANIYGRRNVAVGYNSLGANTYGNQNTSLGNESLRSNTLGSYNVAIGNSSLINNTIGNSNIAIGDNSLASNTGGSNNIAMGHNTLRFNTNGYWNVAIGNDSLDFNTNGNSNTAMGYNSLASNISGNSNTAIGQNAGNNSLGNSNVFLGYRAGYNETGNNKLYIANSDYNTLIYGDFNSRRVGINTTTPTSTMDISGDIRIRNISVNAGLSYLLAVNDSGTLYKLDKTTLGGGSSTPAGSSTQIQYNSGGTAFYASSDFVYSGGFLGVGVSNPNNTIQVAGLINFDDVYESIFLGFGAGKNNTNYNNTAIGYGSLEANADGDNNTAIGRGSLHSNINGTNSTAIGSFALYDSTAGGSNTAIGTESLRFNTGGNYNTTIGVASLQNNKIGSQNTAVGEEAGRYALGNSNVFLGYQAGYNETGSNKLYIANSTSNTLIYGDFLNNTVGINNTSPQYTLDVNGSINSNSYNIGSQVGGTQTFTISDGYTRPCTLTFSGGLFISAVGLGCQ